MRYRSIVSIHEADKASLSTVVAGLDYVPFYIMDLIIGEDSDKYVAAHNLDFQEFLNILSETASAIQHLHQHDLVHLDIKPGNIRIDNSGFPVLLDLGTTKRLSQEDTETKIACTFRYAPKELKLAHLREVQEEPSRAEGKIKRQDIKLSWDLHTLGLTFKEWIDAFLKRIPDAMTTYQRKYLVLMSTRMNQDPYDNEIKDNLGLWKNLCDEIRYSLIGEVVRDLKKISPGVDISSEVPEFSQNDHKTIQVAVSEKTTFTSRLAKTLDHPFLRRLAEVSQLGIVQLVYPTCTHTRLEHTLGAYHNAVKYIRALYCDPLNPLFRQLMEPHDLRAVLLACLLHDIGQFPMAHDFEDIDSKTFSHSSLVRSLIKGERNEKLRGSLKMVFPTLDEIFKEWDVESADVLEILEAKIDHVGQKVRSRILKSIISGPIDADKLDYLVRDGSRLRVPYPNSIDIERLLQCLTLVVKDHGNGTLAYIGVHEKGRVPAEFVTLSRYAMYAQVYWHHGVRSAKSMLMRAVSAFLNSLKDDEEKNRFKSDFERFVLFGGGVASDGGEQLSLLDESVIPPQKEADDSSTFKEEFSGIALNSWDITTIDFLLERMKRRRLPESDLLGDILNRRLYKRVFVFSAEHDNSVWKAFIEQWDSWDSATRVCAMNLVEKEIVDAGLKKMGANGETQFFTKEMLNSVEFRVSAGLPLVTIDVPVSKPGSRIGLEYVLEEDRRALRYSNKICGSSSKDKVWQEYAMDLREKAGRIRIYVHPKFVDMIASCVDKSWMGETLENLSAKLEGMGTKANV
jgi:HD superfamily phosphohydrolase